MTGSAKMNLESNEKIEPKEIRQIVIEDSGIYNGRPRTGTFAGKYGISARTLQDHMAGKPADGHAKAFYRLVRRVNELDGEVKRLQEVATVYTDEGYCSCGAACGAKDFYFYCRRCGARIKWVEK